MSIGTNPSFHFTMEPENEEAEEVEQLEVLEEIEECEISVEFIEF